MPLVKPKEKETQDNFISRCMSDPKSKEEFPNQSQRLAVCNSLFEGGKSMDEKYHKKPKDKDKKKPISSNFLAALISSAKQCSTPLTC